MKHTPILIIDDEPSVLEALRIFLEDEGYEVHEALEGETGLSLFRSIGPDVVVTDLKMPGMPGLDVINEIRKLDTTVPIIVITGYGTLDVAIEAIRSEVHDFITKPIDLDYLRNALDKARSAVQASQEIQKGMKSLHEQVQLLQMEWKDQLSRLVEVEPLVQTGRLVAAILHNLNSPLTYIMGQAELLQAVHPEVENLEVIRDQAIRMRSMMASFIKRLRTSQSRDMCYLQLNEILKEEVFFLESHPYLKSSIDTTWELDDNVPLFDGIAADFSQVFGNILRNAVEAMHGQSTKQLTIHTWYQDSSIHISIQDNGPGIPDHMIDRIFEPFFSSKIMDYGSPGSLGMGIGLYHCRQIVQQYGGSIEVVSKLGSGTAFVIHLPLIAKQVAH
jgi:signal transduction histidine kinase